MPLSRFRLRATALVIGFLLAMQLNAPPIAAAPAAKPQSKAAMDAQLSTAAGELSAIVEQYDAMRVTLAATRRRKLP